MQGVTREWIDNQNELLVSEGFVEVTLTLADPDALADASATDNGATYFSNTAQIVSEDDKDIVPYATLEENLWVLDGSRKILPRSNYGDCGFISSSMSNEFGYFENEPFITIDFSEAHTNLVQGITIDWGTAYGEYAVDFTVRVYSNNVLLHSAEVFGNRDVKSIVYMDIADYDSVTISVHKWCLPYHRARIAEVLIGVEKVYSKGELFSFKHSQEVDPISASLPKSEISFSIDNSDGSYDPNNTESFAKYLMERQKLKAKYGYKIGDKIEWIDSGTFYISEWNAPQNGLTADFTARDLLEFMTDTYYKGLYDPMGTSLYDLAERVLQDADLPLDDDGGVKWIIDESLKDIYTIAPLPVDTHANCLQLIANAGGCVLYQDRSGILHIEKWLATEPDYHISLFNSYSKSDIELTKPLKQVEVPYYTYSVSAEASELFKGAMAISGTQEVVITYSGSATNVSASVVGGTLNSATYYTNTCVLKITASGDVVITVTGYNLETSSVAVITPSGDSGETVTVDNPLITNQERASAVGTWVEGYMKNRMILSSKWRADPRLDALDMVTNDNAYNSNTVIMTNVNYEYNGAFRGSGEGRVI